MVEAAGRCCVPIKDEEEITNACAGASSATAVAMEPVTFMIALLFALTKNTGLFAMRFVRPASRRGGGRGTRDERRKCLAGVVEIREAPNLCVGGDTGISPRVPCPVSASRRVSVSAAYSPHHTRMIRRYSSSAGVHPQNQGCGAMPLNTTAFIQISTTKRPWAQPVEPAQSC